MRCSAANCTSETISKAGSGSPGPREHARSAGPREGRREGREGRESRDGRDGRDGHRHAGGNKIESRYCERHTCSYFLRPESCPYEKPEWDAVCISHTACSVFECRQGKIQYLRADDEPMPVFARLDFCADHKCAFPQCTYIRYQLPVPRGAFQEMCEHHRCTIEGCKKARIDKKRPFCPDHKCRYGNCQIPVAENASFCVGHLKCEVKNCSSIKHAIPNSKDYKQYCQTHIMCSTPNCPAVRDKESCHCTKHTCLDHNCEKSSGKERFCDDHRCTQEECEHPRAWYDRKIRMKFCAQHMCRVPNCGAPVDEESLYCSEHSCDSPNCKSAGVADEKCREHLKEHIDKAAKAKAKAEKTKLENQLRERDLAIRELQDQRVRSLELRQFGREAREVRESVVGFPYSHARSPSVNQEEPLPPVARSSRHGD